MNIPQMLDQLSEYQAQVAYLEQQKQELLDQVKVPAEVLAAQDEANKRRQAIDSALYSAQKEINAQCRAVVADIVEPELPAEYIEAMASYHAQVEAANSQASFRFEKEQKRAAEAKAKIDAELQAKVQDVYTQVAQRKQEINVEFTEKASGAQDNIAKLTAEIKDATKAHGKTEKGQYLTAVYQKGRTTWITDALDTIYFDLNALVDTLSGLPDIADVRNTITGIIKALTKARKVGEPSIAIRKI